MSVPSAQIATCSERCAKYKKFKLFFPPHFLTIRVGAWTTHKVSFNINRLYQFLFMLVQRVKVKWSRYRPGVAQSVGRDIAVLFHDRGTRRGWVVSSTLRPHFTPGKDPVPILQEAGWATGPVWTGGKSPPHRDSIQYCLARSQSLYRLSYLSRSIGSSKFFKSLE